MRDSWGPVMKMLALIMQLGITMMVPIVACTIGAAWLGARTQISWLAVVGFLVGAIAGMQACFRIIKRMTAGMPTEGESYQLKREGERLHEGLKENE